MAQNSLTWKILLLYEKVHKLNYFVVVNQCPRLTACANTDRSKNTVNLQKNSQNQDFEPRFQGLEHS